MDENVSISIIDALKNHAQNQPNRPAFIFVDEEMNRLVFSRQQVWDYCQKFAALLTRTDLGRGRVVCNTLRNSPQRVITELGAITAGAISMNGQTCLTCGSDFMNCLILGEADAIIVDQDDPDGVFHILEPKLSYFNENTGEVSCPEAPSLKYILKYRLIDKRQFFEELGNESDKMHVNINPDDVCQYLCTSGSTCFFKLVAFSSRCLLEYGRHFAEVIGVTEDDVYMNNRVLGWLGGYPTVYLATGSIRVIFDMANGIPQHSSEIQWKIAVQEKCDVAYTAPLYLNEFNQVRLHCKDELKNYKLRTVGVGGGPVSKKMIEAALGNISETVVIAYASTEAGFTTFYKVSALSEFEEFNTGWPTVGSRVKVVNKHGKEVPNGMMGEILIQTTQRALYYVKDPEKTLQTFNHDGWVRLGDMGKINSHGQLYVIGRDKFAILRGSLVFYPETIEAFIRECPGIKEVAVTGVPDELRFEQLCALIIKKPGAKLSVDDVRNYCKTCVITEDEDLAPIPKYFLFVDSLPHSKTGKLERKKIKKKASDMVRMNPDWRFETTYVYGSKFI